MQRKGSDKDRKRMENLKKLLTELAQSQDCFEIAKERASVFTRLENIYCKEQGNVFHPSFSDIFPVLTELWNESSEGSLDILLQNLLWVKNSYYPQNSDGNGGCINIQKQIEELYENLNLEISRIMYIGELSLNTATSIGESRVLIKDINSAFETSKKEITEQSQQTLNEMHDMRKEYITILGIFASIVLAFTGGLTFSSSVLENMAEPSVYRVVLMAFVIGIVFFNLIWLLIDFIRDINGSVICRKWLWISTNAIFIAGISGVFLLYAFRQSIPFLPG